MNDYECPRCCYKTGKKSNMKSHLKFKKSLCKIIGFDIDPRKYESVILREDVSAIFVELMELRKFKSTINIVGDNNNNNTTNNNTNNITITVNAFDNTNTSFLTDKDYKQCIDKISNSIPEMIKKVHFNPEHPENHNIYISNIRDKMAHCYNGNRWYVCKQEELINNLINKYETIITDWLKNNKGGTTRRSRSTFGRTT